MNYRLENLSPDDFEELINTICQKILGIGVVSFTKGPDGGRDGRFNGTANSYPSKSAPWSGKFIIQAKHTTDYQASCSDKTFFGNKSSIVSKEVLKVKKLKKDGEIDNYLLFTNRKETSNREKAVQYIENQTGLKNVDIIGSATISTHLVQHRAIVKQFGFDRFSMPFEFYEKDIRELIIIFHNALPDMVKGGTLVLDRPDIETKNQINNLSSSYYKNIILSDLKRYHTKILDFLQNPINATYAHYYEETAQELKRVIETNREQCDDFKKVFEDLVKFLMSKEPEKLTKYRNIIPVFFHFMYYQCDIGREK